jgi:FMN phosphatase YigB (HAD superfamily)
MMAGYRVRDDDWQAVEGGKEAFDGLVSYFEASQQQVKATYGHFKKWSREVFIKRAAEQAEVAVTPELVHDAADAYWLTLTERTQLFPDALQLSNDIAAHGRPLFMVTNSDARLKMQPDGQFIYDPEFSEALKRKRIELLKGKGLKFDAISIGDPEDKPHPDFFNKALRVAEAEIGAPVDTRNAIMLGDSYGGDLQTPKEILGFGMVVLRENGKPSVQINDASQVSLGALTEAERFLV